MALVPRVGPRGSLRGYRDPTGRAFGPAREPGAVSAPVVSLSPPVGSPSHLDAAIPLPAVPLQSLPPLSAPPIIYALTLLTALLWGFGPILDKRGMDAGGTTLQASIVVVLVDSGLYWLALAGLALVTGVAPFADITLLAAGIFVGAGFVGTALGRLAVFAGVRRVGASINSAAIASRPLFATLLAVALLGESVSLTTVAGIVVLGGGLAVLSLSRGGDIDGWDRRHLAYPVVAAVFFAAGNVARRYGLELTPTTALEAVALNETAALVALLAYAAVVSDADREHLVTAPRRTYGYFTASGVLTAVALLAMFAALAHPAGRVAIVDPLVATAPLFTALFAAVLLRDVERVTVGVVAGALLVVVGAGLVAVG